MSALMSRKFWNPILVLTGGLTLVSGLYLFFHLKSRPIVLIHEWASIIFIVACAAHLALNWNPLLKTLGSRVVTWTLLTLLLFSGLGMAFSVSKDHRHRPNTSQGINRNAEGIGKPESRSQPINPGGTKLKGDGIGAAAMRYEPQMPRICVGIA